MEVQQGATALLQAAGLGKMKPNILLLGYKNDWQVCEKHVLDQYFATIQSVEKSVHVERKPVSERNEFNVHFSPVVLALIYK